jgi:hypothetical protein
MFPPYIVLLLFYCYIQDFYLKLDFNPVNVVRFNINYVLFYNL